MLYHWRLKDFSPDLPLLARFYTTLEVSHPLLASVTQLTKGEIIRREQAGHCAYVAWLGDAPAGYGWVARQIAEIGELNLSFTLFPDSVYLWDFKTISAYRGLGVYPQLLQAILHSENRHAQDFWIIHAPENYASRSGIQRAGFQNVGKLSFLKTEDGVGLVANTVISKADLGADLLQVKRLDAAMDSAVAPCWGCTIARKQATHFTPPACWTDECGCIAR